MTDQQTLDDLLAPPELQRPSHIRFYSEAAHSVLDDCPLEFDHAWLIVSNSVAKFDGETTIEQELGKRRIRVSTSFSIGEPTVEAVDRLAGLLRLRLQKGRWVVIGLGGGSTIDLAKAVAAMATQPDGFSVREYLEGVGSGRQLESDPVPMIAIPTTAGTGAEATKNAVLTGTDPVFKKSLRDDRMIPDLVVLDPALTWTTPKSVTLSTGMDAITQLIESGCTPKATAATKRLSIAGLKAALPAMKTVMQHPRDVAAREAMSFAAFLSGVALANAGLGVAHAIAAPLGVHHRVPHGLACAVMLPIALESHLEDAAGREALANLTAELDGFDSPEAFVAHIKSLCADLGVPQRLGELGVEANDLPQLVAGKSGNSMGGNPRTLSDDELLALLERNR